MSRKVFTAGEVLAAADVNNFLMNQTVMSFAGTASRTASIGTPVEGMYTHLEDTDRLEFWNGSSWTSPHGLTLINTTAINATSVSINDVFSSAYDNYRITINITLANNNNLLSMRLRVGGTDASGSNYDQQGIEVIAGTIQNAPSVGTGTSFSLINIDSGSPSVGSFYTLDLASPFLALPTYHTGTGFGYRSAGQTHQTRGGRHTLSTSYTGFTLISSAGLIQGTVNVYGYRKA
jgi:hypothetical protein